MEQLEQYWVEYKTDYNTKEADAYNWDCQINGGYYCPRCNQWIPFGTYHQCYPITYYYPTENKTEKAFKVLKALVKERVIKEPDSFKKFCELVEKITKVV